MPRKEEPKEGGDEYKFVLPDFDERGFMTREIMGARTTFIAAGVGLVAGLAARLVHLVAGLAGLPWQVGLVAVAGAILVVPRVASLVGVDVDPKDWKVALGNGFLVVATALTVWILLLNEPFV